jgi:hypothetical protein
MNVELDPFIEIEFQKTGLWREFTLRGKADALSKLEFARAKTINSKGN